MPVSINQPLSALQRIAEDLEYSELLDEAATVTGVERMVKVCAFALSTYAKETFLVMCVHFSTNCKYGFTNSYSLFDFL